MRKTNLAVRIMAVLVLHCFLITQAGWGMPISQLRAKRIAESDLGTGAVKDEFEGLRAPSGSSDGKRTTKGLKSAERRELFKRLGLGSLVALVATALSDCGRRQPTEETQQVARTTQMPYPSIGMMATMQSVATIIQQIPDGRFTAMFGDAYGATQDDFYELFSFGFNEVIVDADDFFNFEGDIIDDAAMEQMVLVASQTGIKSLKFMMCDWHGAFAYDQPGYGVDRKSISNKINRLCNSISDIKRRLKERGENAAAEMLKGIAMDIQPHLSIHWNFDLGPYCSLHAELEKIAKAHKLTYNRIEPFWYSKEVDDPGNVISDYTPVMGEEPVYIKGYTPARSGFYQPTDAPGGNEAFEMAGVTGKSSLHVGGFDLEKIGEEDIDFPGYYRDLLPDHLARYVELSQRLRGDTFRGTFVHADKLLGLKIAMAAWREELITLTPQPEVLTPEEPVIPRQVSAVSLEDSFLAAPSAIAEQTVEAPKDFNALELMLMPAIREVVSQWAQDLKHPIIFEFGHKELNSTVVIVRRKQDLVIKINEDAILTDSLETSLDSLQFFLLVDLPHELEHAVKGEVPQEDSVILPADRLQIETKALMEDIPYLVALLVRLRQGVDEGRFSQGLANKVAGRLCALTGTENPGENLNFVKGLGIRVDAETEQAIRTAIAQFYADTHVGIHRMAKGEEAFAMADTTALAAPSGTAKGDAEPADESEEVARATGQIPPVEQPRVDAMDDIDSHRVRVLGEDFGTVESWQGREVKDAQRAMKELNDLEDEIIRDFGEDSEAHRLLVERLKTPRRILSMAMALKALKGAEVRPHAVSTGFVFVGEVAARAKQIFKAAGNKCIDIQHDETKHLAGMILEEQARILANLIILGLEEQGATDVSQINSFYSKEDAISTAVLDAVQTEFKDRNIDFSYTVMPENWLTDPDALCDNLLWPYGIAIPPTDEEARQAALASVQA